MSEDRWLHWLRWDIGYLGDFNSPADLFEKDADVVVYQCPSCHDATITEYWAANHVYNHRGREIDITHPRICRACLRDSLAVINHAEDEILKRLPDNFRLALQAYKLKRTQIEKQIQLME